MRNSKENIKNTSNSRKNAVVAKSIKSKEKIKVVEVELPNRSKKLDKGKQALPLKQKANSTNPPKTLTPVKTKSVITKLKQPQLQPLETVKKAKGVTANALVVPKIEKKVKEVPVTQPVTVVSMNAPSVEVLRPFRNAAKRNRELAKQTEKLKAAKTSFLAKPPKKGKKYAIDLRVHSPGTVGYFSAGGIDPGPALVRLAQVKGLDIIGITDYYNASYLDLLQNAKSTTGLTILPGVDLCCSVSGCKEVYVLVLFSESTSSQVIFEMLEALNVPKSAYGQSDYCLSMDFSEILRVVESYGGIIIPSGIDKTPYRQLAIPALVEEYGIHAFDLSHPDSPEFFRSRWPDGGFTFFSFSNANALGQIGNRMGRVKLTNPGFQGLQELVARRLTNQHKN